MATRSNWNYPTAVRFGAGRIAELPEALKAVGINKPLFVTDAGLVNLPVTQNTLKLLRDAGIEVGVFSDVQPNPPGSNVDAGVAVLRAGDHDGVIAFGGGSGLDVGKTIAFMASQTRPLWDFEDIGDWWTRADPKAILPIIAVPTTAGTGSEVGRASVITDEAAHTKKIIFHPLMQPKLVIADPELTVGMPRTITVGTGFDALAHCLEAYCAPGYHPLADGIGVEGVRLVLENLPKVIADPNDIEARGNMLSAALMGATAFQKGLGAIHSLSHPIGALYNTHHGMTNGTFMPYVLVANRDAIEARIARLAAYCGLPGSFDAFLTAILALREKLGVPHTLRDLKVPADRRAEIAVMAVADPSTGTNPVKLDEALALRIFDMAMDGKLN